MKLKLEFLMKLMLENNLFFKHQEKQRDPFLILIPSSVCRPPVYNLHCRPLSPSVIFISATSVCIIIQLTQMYHQSMVQILLNVSF